MISNDGREDADKRLEEVRVTQVAKMLFQHGFSKEAAEILHTAKTNVDQNRPKPKKKTN